MQRGKAINPKNSSSNRKPTRVTVLIHPQASIRTRVERALWSIAFVHAQSAKRLETATKPPLLILCLKTGCREHRGTPREQFSAVRNSGMIPNVHLIACRRRRRCCCCRTRLCRSDVCFALGLGDNADLSAKADDSDRDRRDGAEEDEDGDEEEVEEEEEEEEEEGAGGADNGLDDTTEVTQ